LVVTNEGKKSGRNLSPSRLLWFLAWLLATTPRPPFCVEKWRLSDAFLEAARDIVRLQNAESKAVAEGTSLERFELAVNIARERKDAAKLAYMLRVQSHGC
jgi:hypothetical protein